MANQSRFCASSLFLVCCLLGVGCDEDESPAMTAPDASDDSMQPDSGSVGTFCDAYEAACGFGKDNTFSDREDCEEDFGEKFNADRRECATEHLTLAADDADAHCEAAKGDDVCR